MATRVKDCKVQTMKLKRREKGFTIIELLVSLAILGAIMGVMSAAVIIIMKTSSQNNEWNINLRQVQNAGYWISKDALMAQVVDTAKPDVFLSLSWSDWSGDSYTVDYVVLEDDTLRRRLNDGPEFLIAEYIVPADTTCEWIGGENKLKVTIKASVHDDEDRYVERTYEISPRPVAKGD
jgi:prepilin-type N-terminal cleavage/methylation domain-containing protein